MKWLNNNSTYNVHTSYVHNSLYDHKLNAKQLRPTGDEQINYFIKIFRKILFPCISAGTYIRRQYFESASFVAMGTKLNARKQINEMNSSMYCIQFSMDV